MTNMFTTAIVRFPGPNFALGLTTANLGQPDYTLMKKQHAAYIAALRFLGLTVVELPHEVDYPDAYFVEDTAVITPEIAVITLPGAISRREEIETIAPVLARHREIVRIQPPGLLDGGDVLIVGKKVFVGLSARTNAAGGQQLGEILSCYGYEWTLVPVSAGLHLKSSVNCIDTDMLIITPALAKMQDFQPYQQLIVAEDEIYAANSLLINGTVLTPQGFPKTHQALATLGLNVTSLDVSEVQKMDGGLTCLSLRF